jgi:Ca-activated chloride channel family protein
VDVAAGGDLLVELPPPPPFPPTVEMIPDRPVIGDTVWVRRWGDPAPGVEWTAAIARQEDPPGSWLTRAAPVGNRPEVSLLVPDPGRATLEARILEGPIGGPVAVVARRPLEPVRPAVLLDLPEEAETGTPLRIGWTGPDLEGDRIELERTDPPEGGSTVCLPVTDARGEVTISAPLEPGTYRARYLLGPIRATATVRSLNLFEILARLEVPDTVAVGERVEIRWEGPAEPHDFLALAEPGAPDEAYGPWSPAQGGSPTTLEAPPTAGTWEVRYVDGASGEILARAELVVEELAVTLDAPARVTAGTRFEVRWTGTTSPGDIVAVAPAGAPAGRILDWVATEGGSPASLAAPFSPGSFEVRYLRPASRDVLASVPLEVAR